MARSIWTGVISFGLVSVPVKVHSATRDHDVSFHQFQEGTDDRVRYQRVNERTGKEVDYGDIVKGADVGDGYVMLDADELDSVAPGRSRSLDIHTFVEQAEIDPIYYQKTYYLAPGTDEAGRTYALLRDAMARAERVAIGSLVMRGKEYLAAIRADDDLLVLETMFFADEIRDPKQDLDGIPSRTTLKPSELKMAVQLIDSMTGPWRPSEFRDTYTDRVNELIEAKKDGNEVTVSEEAPAATNVVDLMGALKASVDAAKKNRAAGGSKVAAGGGKAAGAKAAGGKAAGAKAAGAKAAGTKPASKKAAAGAKKSAPKKRAAGGSSKAGAAKATPKKKAAGRTAA